MAFILGAALGPSRPWGQSIYLGWDYTMILCAEHVWNNPAYCHALTYLLPRLHLPTATPKPTYCHT